MRSILINSKVTFSWIVQMASSGIHASYLRSDGYCEHGALGLRAPIAAFNVPLMTLVAKITPAVATGNAVALKPSQRNSFVDKFIVVIYNSNKIDCYRR